MKSFLFLFLLVLWGYSFGQRVPNTTNFSLQNVTAVTGGGSLNDAFTNSVSGNFNPIYGSKTMNPKTLYGFRDYGPNITGISSVTYVRQLSMGETISSVEISNDGTNLYLIYPTAKRLRKYGLSTPFNISTLFTYQDYDLSVLGVGLSCRGLYLSPDEKKISFIDGQYVRTIEFTVANDLTTEYASTAYPVGSYISASVFNVSFDPTGHYCTISGLMVGGQRRTYTLYTSATFELSGGVNYTNMSVINMTGAPIGFEWSSTGYNMYTIDYLTNYIYNYPITPTAYMPSTIGVSSIGGQSLIISGMLYNDFCFNNSLTKMFAITNSNASAWYLLEFNLQ